MASDVLNRIGVFLDETGDSGTLLCDTLISELFNTPVQASAVNGKSYWWLVEEGQDYMLFEGVWDSGTNAVTVGTIWKSKILGVVGTTRLTLAGNATLRSPTPAEMFRFFHRKGANVASAATINLDTATGDLIDVTGTTTITGVTLAEGQERTVRFLGALTLTHSSSLVLPSGGANITTAVGDTAVFRGYGSGNTVCVSYQRYSGLPTKPGTHARSSFATSGTFTTPADSTVNTVYSYRMIGGGGGGGGSNTTAGAAGGGASGTYMEGTFTGIAPSTAISIGIGAGGAGGSTAGTNGVTGGNTTIGSPISASVPGGGGGTGTVSGIGAGGTPFSGPVGGTSSVYVLIGGQSGQTGGPGGIISSSVGYGGRGADSQLGVGGQGGAAGQSAGAISNAVGYGAGGGGGFYTGGNGSLGSSGLVMIERILN